jgi:hypothetical protein
MEIKVTITNHDLDAIREKIKDIHITVRPCENNRIETIFKRYSIYVEYFPVYESYSEVDLFSLLNKEIRFFIKINDLPLSSGDMVLCEINATPEAYKAFLDFLIYKINA